jgi:hypothetical protein
MSEVNQPGAAMIGEAPPRARQQSCNFILSALANFTGTLAKLTIKLGREQITRSMRQRVPTIIGRPITGHMRGSSLATGRAGS